MFETVVIRLKREIVERCTELLPLTCVLHRNFEYPEQREVDKYYPQYYHRTDKVSLDDDSMGAKTIPARRLTSVLERDPCRTADRSTSNNSASSTSTSCTRSPPRNVNSNTSSASTKSFWVNVCPRVPTPRVTWLRRVARSWI